MSFGKLVFMTETPGNGRPAAAAVPGLRTDSHADARKGDK